MQSLKDKKVLISGASFAGLSTAYWMLRSGYKVTLVEISKELKRGGTPVNIESNTIDVVKRMGIFEQIKQNRLKPKMMAFKNADDITENCMPIDDEHAHEDACEIERDVLLDILFDTIKDKVECIFNDTIVALHETKEDIEVTFKSGTHQSFHLVFGCDGIHSAVRKIWFGNEAGYMHFLGQYFSITIVNKLLIPDDAAQMYNVPGKAIMLNTYNGKTDIIFCFRSEKEISYDYRNESQQRKIIFDQFTEEGWRTQELLEEVKNSKTFYFDKLCQVKMPSWTKGMVALVGDAGYCASPAAGKGGSLAIDGAAALADAFRNNNENFEQAFHDYNTNFRPYIDEIQSAVVNFGLDMLVPETEEAIRLRNTRVS